MSPITARTEAADIEVDVLVVGAGPAGLTVANYLGLMGVRTLVAERNPTTVQEPRAVSIDDEALRTMQAIGLIDRVLPTIVAGYGARYYTPTGRPFARIAPTAREYGYHRRSAFRQPVLEAILREGLARFPSVDLRFGCTLTRFEQAADGVTAWLRDGAGGESVVRAAYLAACDGASSTVRGQLGIAMAGATFEERWLVLDAVDYDNEERDSIAYCDHARPAISLPGPERTRRWEFLVHPHERAEDFLEEAKIRDLLAGLGASSSTNIVRRTVYTFHARIAERWQEGRVFLIGDAVHLTPPYAGQGMNSGQRDALNFAWKAAAVVAGRLPPAALASYEPERRDHAWQLIRMALQIGRVMVPRNWLHTWGQVAFFRLIGVIPALRDYVLQMRFKPKPRIADGLMVPDGETPRRTRVGRMFPQPLVTRADGSEVLLDDVIGPRFALVAWGADPEAALAGLADPLWQRLDAHRIAILPAGAPSQDVAGVDAVVRADEPVPLGDGEIVLLRPDRYAAGVFSAAGEAAFSEAFRRVAGIV
jgi:3-(3-hydroxy-phenyl)propionate hydroxylase